MKVLALTIVFLMLALIAFARSLSRIQVGQVSPEVSDFLHEEPFHGSKVGNTVARACGNCHSNQTKLPWYGHIAPVSWWIEGHIRHGRAAMNFSDWAKYPARVRRDELESVCGVVSNGRMPPKSYTALHPEARLRDEDKIALCMWAANEIKQEN
jgi:hypothetical protein